MDRQQIVANNPIERVCEFYNIALKPKGNELVGLCPWHDDHDPSFKVNPSKQVFLCAVCQKAGSVIDLVMEMESCSAGEAMKKLSTDSSQKLTKENNNETTTTTEAAWGTTTQKKIVCAYDYMDARGHLVYQVVRFSPKDFRGRRPNPDNPSEFIWNMQGIDRVLYNLAEVITAEEVVCVEGEKDADTLKTIGVCATTHAGGTGGTEKSIPTYMASLKGKTIYICADNDDPGRESADKLAAALKGVSARVLKIAVPTLHKDISDYLDTFSALSEKAERFYTLKEQAVVYAAYGTPCLDAARKLPKPAPDPLTAASDDPRPKIQLPGDDRTVSSFALDLAAILRPEMIFRNCTEVVTLNVEKDGLQVIKPELLSTWIEQHAYTYKLKSVAKHTFQINRTLPFGDARSVLASHEFTGGLRKLRRVHPVRLPVIRADGRLELLDEGYDEATETLTMRSAVAYTDMDLEQARAVLDDLFGEFAFPDEGRSKAVAISAMLTLFAGGILRRYSLRPCFDITANAEGAGKTILVTTCVVPIIGYMPTSSKPEEETEMRKLLLACVREAKLVLVLDNTKGNLSSPSLEGFLSSPIWEDRILGATALYKADNLATVFITDNLCRFTPDMRRRSLVCRLHLAQERAEDRTFKASLSISSLLAQRQRILSALWALCRHWDALDRPKPSTHNSSFAAWSDSIAGIVEASGYLAPTLPDTAEDAKDTDTQDMRLLVAALANELMPLAFDDLVTLAKENSLFDYWLGGEGKLNPQQRTGFSRLVNRYVNRQVGDCTLLVHDNHPHRRFHSKKLS